MLLCVASAYAMPAAHIVVDERFADRNRSVQSAPDSLEWFASVPANTNVRGNYLHIVARRDGSREAVAHFPAVELAAGQMLVLEFDFHFGIEPTNNEAAFSVGLFDTSAQKTNRIDKDQYDETANESEGYAVFLNPRTTGGAAAFSLVRRSGKGPLLPYTIVPGGRIGPVTQLDAPLYPHRAYHADLRLQVDADGKLQIHFELSGGGIPAARITTFSPPANAPDTFDTVAFRITRPGVSDVYITHISIVHETQPPQGKRALQ